MDENTISELNQARAVEIFQSFCAFLDSNEWKYDKDEGDLSITIRAIGDSLPIDFIIQIDKDRDLIKLLSPFVYKIPDEKRMELAIATCIATNRLADGSFDLDMESGRIFFRMNVCYAGSKIGEGLFSYMIGCSMATIDAYCGKMFALGKGYLSLDDFRND